MGTLRKAVAAIVLASAAASPAMAADPFITVKPAREGGTNSAFWIMEMESRPTGTMVAGLSLDRINLALGRGQNIWCAADALGPASFASSDPAVRAEIARYLGTPGGNVFRATTRMTGVPLTAIVGNYRSCFDQVAPFLLLVDQNRPVPRVVYVHMFTDWTPFIALRADRNRLVLSSCLECDHAIVLSWNPRTRRFALRSEGR
jgi:hypothetical protein